MCSRVDAQLTPPFPPRTHTHLEIVTPCEGQIQARRTPDRVYGSDVTKAISVSCDGVGSKNQTRSAHRHFVSRQYQLTINSVSIGSDRMESTSYEHRRAYNEHNFDVFCDKISDIDWSSVMNIMDCNLAYSMFNSVFLNCYNHVFLLRLR